MKNQKQNIVDMRKRVLDDELNRYVRILREKADPEKIIVFGSTATGDIHQWSDIDLVIINKTDLPFLKRMRAIRKLIQPQVGVDILCYTPDEFSELCKERNFFQEEILEKGKILYERPN